MKATFLVCLIAAFSISTLFAQGVQVLTNPQTNKLEVRSGQEVKYALDLGTVGQEVTVGDQTFKLSFGKGLSGKPVVMIYGDPAKTSSISANVFGRPVALTKLASLVVELDGSGQPESVQAGPVGEVKIADVSLPKGKAVKMADVGVQSVPAVAQKQQGQQKKEATQQQSETSEGTAESTEASETTETTESVQIAQNDTNTGDSFDPGFDPSDINVDDGNDIILEIHEGLITNPEATTPF